MEFSLLAFAVHLCDNDRDEDVLQGADYDYDFEGYDLQVRLELGQEPTRCEEEDHQPPHSHEKKDQLQYLASQVPVEGPSTGTRVGGQYISIRGVIQT